jgi:hypothetical protein
MAIIVAGAILLGVWVVLFCATHQHSEATTGYQPSEDSQPSDVQQCSMTIYPHDFETCEPTGR